MLISNLVGMGEVNQDNIRPIGSSRLDKTVVGTLKILVLGGTHVVDYKWKK